MNICNNWKQFHAGKVMYSFSQPNPEAFKWLEEEEFSSLDHLLQHSKILEPFILLKIQLDSDFRTEKNWTYHTVVCFSYPGRHGLVTVTSSSDPCLFFAAVPVESSGNLLTNNRLDHWAAAAAAAFFPIQLYHQLSQWDEFRARAKQGEGEVPNGVLSCVLYPPKLWTWNVE